MPREKEAMRCDATKRDPWTPRCTARLGGRRKGTGARRDGGGGDERMRNETKQNKTNHGGGTGVPRPLVYDSNPDRTNQPTTSSTKRNSQIRTFFLLFFFCVFFPVATCFVLRPVCRRRCGRHKTKRKVSAFAVLSFLRACAVVSPATPREAAQPTQSMHAWSLSGH